MFKSIKFNLFFLLIVLCSMWTIFIVNQFILLGYLNQFGIVPRTAVGLVGIPLAPFLHLNFSHIANNTICFVFLSVLIALIDFKRFVSIFWSLVFFCGLLTWVFGPSNTDNIGMSGVIFGLVGYLVGQAFFNKKYLFLIFAIGVLYYQGWALVHGLIPQEGISWIGHFGGLIAGVLLTKASFFEK